MQTDSAVGFPQEGHNKHGIYRISENNMNVSKHAWQLSLWGESAECTVCTFIIVGVLKILLLLLAHSRIYTLDTQASLAKCFRRHNVIL